MRHPLRNILLPPGLFLSSLCTLVNEVIWFHLIQTLTGSALIAASLATAVFMTGLALGALFAGRILKKGRNPVSIFAFVEFLMVVALWAAFALFLLAKAGFPGAPLTLVFPLTFLALFPLTGLMGASLPAAVEALNDAGNKGRVVGLTYAVSALGGAAGAFLAAFILMPFLGTVKTLALISCVHAVVGATVLFLRAGYKPPSPAPIALATPVGRPFLALYAVIGFVSMGCEILWIRLTDLRFLASVYSFGLVLALFLTGTGLGSLFYRTRPPKRPGALLLFLVPLYGLSIGASFFWLNRLPPLVSQDHFLRALGWEAAIVSIAVLVPTLLSGFLFPLCVRLCSKTETEAGADTGRVYAWNTFGTVAAAFLFPLLFINFLGLSGTLVAASLFCSVLLPFLFFLVLPDKSRRPAPLMALALLCALPAVYLALYPPRFTALSPGRKQIVYYREGPLVTAAVADYANPPARALEVNLIRTEGGTQPEALFSQRLQCQVPLSLHPAPREILLLGLGTGISAGALVPNRIVERIHCVEISPEIVAAAAFFSEANRGILIDPRTCLFTGDARRFVASARGHYDVIIGDLFFPWLKGSGLLYSRDHFQNCRKRLKPGGLFCQWLPLYQLSPGNLATIRNTFASVFGNARLYLGHAHPEKPTAALIGFADMPAPEAASFRCAGDLRFNGSLPVTTDLFPLTEYFAARDFFEQDRFTRLNLEEMVYALDQVTDTSAGHRSFSLLWRSAVLLNRGDPAAALSALEPFPEADTAVPGLEYALIPLAQAVHDRDTRVLMPRLANLLDRAARGPGADYRIHGFLGRFLLLGHENKAAAEALERCVALNPDEDNAWVNLGVARAMMGRVPEAREAWRRALMANPGNLEASYNLSRDTR